MRSAERVRVARRVSRALPAALAVLAGLAAWPALAAANPLYVVNQTSGSLSVIDTATNAVTETIAVGTTPLNVAVSPDGLRAYVTNLGSDDVSVVDTTAGEVVDTVPVGQDPAGVAVSPQGDRAYVADGGSASLSVIDTGADEVVDTIPLSGTPRAVAVSPDGARAYVTDLAADAVLVIDLAARTVGSIPVGADPVALGITPDGRHVWVASALASVLGGADISVIDSTTDTVADTIVNPFPFGIAIAPDGARAYTVSTALSVIDTGTASVIDSVPIGNGLNGLAVSPDGERAYTASNAANLLSVVDTSSVSVIDRIPVGELPMGLAIGPDQGPSAAFAVAAGLAGRVTAFDARSAHDPDSEIVRYDWDFGDGTRAPDGGPTPTHIYSDPGTYDVSLTVTNADGCSTEVIFTGQTVSCNGGPKASLALPVTIAAADPPSCRGASVGARGGARPTAVALDCSGLIDTLSIVAEPLNGTLSPIDQDDRTVLYTPDPGFLGPDRFRYVADGPGGPSEPATIALNVRSGPPIPSRLRVTAISLRRPRSKLVVAGAIDPLATGAVRVVWKLRFDGRRRRRGAPASIDAGRFLASIKVPRRWHSRFPAGSVTACYRGSTLVRQGCVARRVTVSR